MPPGLAEACRRLNDESEILERAFQREVEVARLIEIVGARTRASALLVGPSSVGKTALGTDRFLEAYREPSPAAAAKEAAEEGFRVVAVELASGAVPLADAPLDGDICLAIGNEDHGCSPALLAAVHSVAYIPQTGRVGSLNVAVAAAIAMAETRRREWHPDR